MNKKLLILLLATVPVMAFAMVHFLVSSYFENGNQMCKYDNGTVLNIGIGICPLSIES